MKRIGIFIVLYYHIFASRFPCSLPPRRPIQRAYVDFGLIWWTLWLLLCILDSRWLWQHFVGHSPKRSTLPVALYSNESNFVLLHCVKSICIHAGNNEIFQKRNFSIYWLLIDFILVLVFRIGNGARMFFSDSAPDCLWNGVTPCGCDRDLQTRHEMLNQGKHCHAAGDLKSPTQSLMKSNATQRTASFELSGKWMRVDPTRRSIFKIPNKDLDLVSGYKGLVFLLRE